MDDWYEDMIREDEIIQDKSDVATMANHPAHDIPVQHWHGRQAAMPGINSTLST